MNLSKKAIWLIILASVNIMLICTGLWNILKASEPLMGWIEIGLSAALAGVLVWLTFFRKWNKQ